MGCGAGKEKGIKPAGTVPEVQSQQERGQLGETDARAAATGQNEERKGAVEPAPTPATKTASSDEKNEEWKVYNYERELKKLKDQIAATSDKEEKSKLIKRLNEVEKQHQVTDSADVWARQPLEV